VDDRLRRLAALQADIVAAWQLAHLGWTPRMVDHHGRHHWRRVHRGVYALTNAPLTRRQSWIAAAISTADSALSHASGGDYWGFRPFDGGFETITRPGTGGPRRFGALLVCRSRTLEANVEVREGLRVTTAARTLIDLSPHLTEAEVRKAFREAIRLKVTHAAELESAAANHRGHPGAHRVGRLAVSYPSVPYARCRSDAEARALEILHDAAFDAPRLNTRIAGEEADLAWPARRLIIEIDGPQYHRFAEEDARKTRTWEAAGYEVRRIQSNLVFSAPQALLRLVAG
jgi:very-short-patch-repair endonuclease